MYGRNSAANDWTEFHYKVRVRPPPPSQLPQCIWGSAGLLQDVPFAKPLILHIRNDLFGDPVTFGTLAVSASPPSQPSQKPMGTLQPGECISIPLNGYSGVFAQPNKVESTLYCSIKASA
jgi:hypothetical protein